MNLILEDNHIANKNPEILSFLSEIQKIIKPLSGVMSSTPYWNGSEDSIGIETERVLFYVSIVSKDEPSLFYMDAEDLHEHIQSSDGPILGGLFFEGNFSEEAGCTAISNLLKKLEKSYNV
jgi:hypothetical protein